jgi:3-oxoacyl-[acyl-carrier-protein] synthase-3
MRSKDPRAAARMGADGPEFAREACALLLERAGYTTRDVDLFVTAQPTAWFTETCAAAVGVPADKTVPLEEHFQRFGHLLAASLPLNLWVAWSTGRLRKGDLVLAYSPGVGFTQTAALLRWAMPPPADG